MSSSALGAIGIASGTRLAATRACTQQEAPQAVALSSRHALSQNGRLRAGGQRRSVAGGSGACQGRTAVPPPVQAILKGLGGMFSTDPAEKTRRKYEAQVAAVNALEPAMAALTNEQLRGRTEEFRRRLAGGEPLDALLVEAFAVRAGGRVGPGPRGRAWRVPLGSAAGSHRRCHPPRRVGMPRSSGDPGRTSPMGMHGPTAAMPIMHRPPPPGGA